MGTWAVEGEQMQRSGIVSETQTILDLSLSPTGSFTLHGGETGTLALPFVRSYTNLPDGNFTADIRSDQMSTSGPQARMILRGVDTDTQFFEQISVSFHAPGVSRNYYAGRETRAEAALFTQDGFTLTLDQTLTPSSTTTPIASISGSMTVGNREIRAGEESVLKAGALLPVRGEGTGYRRSRFSEDGLYQSDYVGLDGTISQSISGTWEQVGDQAVISVTSPSSYRLEMRIEREGSTLRLIERISEDCDAECLSMENALDVWLRPGTLQQAWTERVVTFSPVSE